MKSIFLEVTRACNLRCLFCSNRSYWSLQDEFSTEELLSLIDELHELGVVDLRFYGGEPFLRSDLFEVIAKARTYHMAVSIYTNGTVLNARIVKALQEQDIRKLFLSVDSATPAVHNRIRGIPGSFDIVIANIRTLVSSGLNVDVLLTICGLNKSDINATYQLLHSLGVGDVKANFVSRVGKAVENWDQLGISISEMRACVKVIKEVHYQLFERVPVRKPCQAGTGELFIAADGDVFPCALFLDEEHKAGNVRNKKIRQILDQPDGLLKQIREVVQAQEFCPSCQKKDVCGGGCRARAVAYHNGDLHAPDISSCLFHKEVES